MCSRSERYDQRTKLARTTTLRFCGHYPVYSVIPNDTMSQCFKGSYQQCKQCFQDLEDRDNYVNKIYCQFLNIMDRTDCETSYSAIHTSNCHTCKQAYKDWLCAYHIPYYRAGQLIVPCMDYCTEIENRCPYLLPAMDDQYSGEPTFLCTDHHAHAAAKQTTPCHRLISPKKDRVCLHINNHTSSRGHQVASCLTTLVISLWLYRTVKSCTSIGLT
ncbi:NALCN channel auxiliary factor 1-like isoform X2 [Tubulanus polymorphus]|uniref:NALCN channel auxiliary factor 1-like isoform X2 n=1 Tax=Tubulanus polymorphus TaxID=672921 RepID=UPI003DA63C87